MIKLEQYNFQIEQLWLVVALVGDKMNDDINDHFLPICDRTAIPISR